MHGDTPRAKPTMYILYSTFLQPPPAAAARPIDEAVCLRSSSSKPPQIDACSYPDDSDDTDANLDESDVSLSISTKRPRSISWHVDPRSLNKLIKRHDAFPGRQPIIRGNHGSGDLAPCRRRKQAGVVVVV